MQSYAADPPAPRLTAAIAAARVRGALAAAVAELAVRRYLPAIVPVTGVPHRQAATWMCPVCLDLDCAGGCIGRGCVCACQDVIL